MPADETEGVTKEEVATPEIADQQPVTEPETQEEAPAEAVEKVATEGETKKSTKEDNLRQQGRVIEDLKRQNAELQSALVRMVPPAQKQQEAQPEPDELAGLDDDDFVSVSQVKKLAEKIVKQTVQSAMKEGRVERIEESFKTKHDDYDDVVNQDNFERLFKDVPELKPVLARAYELAVKGEDIDPVSLSYKLLKQYSNTGDEEMVNKKSPSDEKLNRNQAKPLSANAIKSSALTEAHKYMGGKAPSKEDRARIYKETVEAAKNR
jgi:hypothetical protein